MKNIKVCGLLMLVCLAFNLNAFGQQAERVIKLKLTDPETKTSQTYLLNNVVYSFTKSQETGLAKDPGTCAVSIDFKQDMDPFLLKWIAGEIKEADGSISMEATEIGKPTRTIAFKGGTSGNVAESFMASDRTSYIQMSLYVRALIIDGVAIYTEQKK
ncbi:hypothetical protein [Pedobacter sp. V48]|uniref:hypothetical protein n=1 Tax=Pedobacter sp. V48 TaxID=509635 RepID=UPI0003E458B0|nr:hypothetical protein [Pedobacter sp. V48]ETZ22135.1 hypothetical protein N824_24735 [Pedobacter sp. V48]